MRGKLIWAVAITMVALVIDNMRLRFALVKTEKMALEATQLAERFRSTNDTCFNVLDSCRDTMVLLGDRGRELFEFRLSPAFDKLQRRADRYNRMVWASGSRVPRNIGPLGMKTAN